MATDQVDESRDIGTLLHEEQKVLEMIATRAPLAVALNAPCRVIDQQSGFTSAVFLVDGDGDRLIQAAGPHLPGKWRQATSSLRLTPRTAIRLRRDAEALPHPSLTQSMSDGGIVGVGIAVMSERMEQLGGRLEIASGDHGTNVRAWVPLVNAAV